VLANKIEWQARTAIFIGLFGQFGCVCFRGAAGSIAARSVEIQRPQSGRAAVMSSVIVGKTSPLSTRRGIGFKRNQNSFGS
jgi:hypothetical protein